MPKNGGEKDGGSSRMEIPAWGFIHAGHRVGKNRQPTATAPHLGKDLKWRGTHRDYVFRLSLNG